MEVSEINLLANKESLIDNIIDLMPESLIGNIDKDNLPKELDIYVEQIFRFVLSVKSYYTAISDTDSDEVIVKALAKTPHGLSIFDELHESRCQVWGMSIKLFISIIDSESPLKSKVKEIEATQSFGEALRVCSPKSEAFVTPQIKTLIARFTGKTSTEHRHELFRLFKGMLVCQLSGLNEQADIFADMLIKAFILNQQSHAILMREQIIKNIAVLEQNKLAGKKGGKKTQQGSLATSEEAIALFLSTNEFTSYTKAAEALYPQIVEIGKKHDFIFNSVVNGHRTVINWFRSTERFKKQKV
ncbi:hypothetical protein [Shewanella sp. SR43-8]|uniref:hypothetical protein n=2 Tax=unclassified Shewanella TaxID=196818 RepID=UPI00160175F7|nr:hypothetical protein [Shewanella sp. SR43-8]MBB1320189.1 hypothetical protein [Shewanella sp. SR43-8]